jgi:alpha-tubulin suppressor-like RCC1 family protein
VRCWGANPKGQLGDGTTVDKSVLPDTDVLTDVQAIATGETHTCALTTSGGVRCWGSDEYSELGDDTYVTRLTPPATDVLTDVKAIAAGQTDTCAVTRAGGVRCWGANDNGALGDAEEHRTPPQQDVLAGVADIATTGAFTCALMETGGVRCWGEVAIAKNCVVDGPRSEHCDYEYGGTSHDLLIGASGIAAGGGDIGVVYSGSGAVSIRGNYPFSQTNVFAGMAPVRIAVGASHVCGLDATGRVTCVGLDQEGQLGRNLAYSGEPATEGVLNDAIAIAAGNVHSCAVTVSGGVYCWGENRWGKLGDGKPMTHAVPPQNDIMTDVKAIAVGGYHACAVTTAGGLRCWGRNLEGQLGDGTTIDRNVPPPSDVLTDVQGVAAGSFHTCVLTNAGAVRCWGVAEGGFVDNRIGQSPAPLTDIITDVQAITANSIYTCALTKAGGVRCWDAYLWDVSATDLLTGVKAIGGAHYAIMMDGSLKQFSPGHFGTADDTALLADVQSVAAGYEFSCAVMTSGGVRCWGTNNANGQLGPSATAPDDEFFGSAQSIAAGDWHACALTNTGGVRCWGSNGFGQLGIGTESQGNFEVPENDAISGVRAIAAGGAQTCVLTTAGGVRCWGDDTYGQLGDGMQVRNTVPVHVIGTCD